MVQSSFSRRRGVAFGVVAAATLAIAALCTETPALAATHAYAVGEIIIYDNPNDDVPARRGRVTKVSGDQIWVDFGEFNPGLNVADASKVLFRGTNQVDDWTKPAASDGGDKNDGRSDAEVATRATHVTRPVRPLVQPAAALPGDISSVFGRWSTLQIGHTVLTAPGDGYIYQKQEIAAKAGEIIIRPNGTFSWNSKSEGMINGTWRVATTDELRGGFGGPGIRIIHGESGWDYNVQRRPQTGVQPADSIAIWTQGYQVNGYRVG